MKKSKLIVPAALAVMLLSTAASVTGTVAWFTANRAVETSISSFKVSSIDGNLELTMGAGYGTTESNNVISVSTTNSALTDASYNVNGTFHRSSYKSTETTKYTAVTPTAEGDCNRVVSTTTYWYVVTWTMTFDYTFAGDSASVNLYFNLDTAKSKITHTQAQAAATGNSAETYKGFRIAFEGTTNSTAKIVWAPEQTASNCKTLNYTTLDDTANPAKTDAGVDYSGVTVLASDTTAGITEAAETCGTAANNYIGQFTTTNKQIALKCTAWFEGTDPNVINGARMDEVVAYMGFFVRTNA